MVVCTHPCSATITEKGVELGCVIGLHACDARVQPVQDEAKPQLKQDGDGKNGDQHSNKIDWLEECA